MKREKRKKCTPGLIHGAQGNHQTTVFGGFVNTSRIFGFVSFPKTWPQSAHFHGKRALSAWRFALR
jgi:hypothetical protein